MHRFRRAMSESWQSFPEFWLPAIYACAACIYIYYSDRVIILLAGDMRHALRWSILKGWFFVAATAVLLCIVLRRVFVRIRRAESQLRAWNETLEQQVAQRTALAEQRAAQLRDMALQLTRAEQQERRRVAQVLHENFQQLLVAAKFNISLLQRHPDRPSHEPLEHIDEAINEAVRVSRLLTVELSPPIIYDVGLLGALRWLARWMHERYGLDVVVDISPGVPEPREEDLRVMLFQVARELLLNVVKHAGTQCARMQMNAADSQFHLYITDDGAGFDPGDRGDTGTRRLATGCSVFASGSSRLVGVSSSIPPSVAAHGSA